MSFRGGRGGGGFRGGRGGGPKPGGGPIIPKELEVKPDFGPTELFPEYDIPFQDPLSSEEKIWIARFRDHREKIHNGPLYTIQPKKRGLEDPFEDVQTYSKKKYHKARRKVPKLDSRPYVFEFFPSELYTTLDPSYTADQTATDNSTNTNTTKRDKKRLLISSLNTNLPNGDISDSDVSDIDGTNATKKRSKAGVLANLMNGGDDEDGVLDGGDANADEEEGDGEDEDVEDEYQDDEEGDYNAEQYFSGGSGDEDYGDEDGGGGAFYD